MTHKNLVQGIPRINHGSQICDACLVGKHSRAPFPNQSSYKSLKPLDLVYRDLCGPISPSTNSGKKYVFLIVDDCTRYMWAYFLESKDQAFENFKEFKLMVENEVGTRLKMLRTDRGGEFTSNEFSQYCKDNGIARQLTAPYSPQQNGLVERRNRTIMSTTRSMLKASNMPQNFWGEAVRHAIYVLNRVPTKALTNCTPYEALKGRKPILDHLRIFGCIAYAKVALPHLKKLDDRSTQMVYLGAEPGSKAYRLFDPISKRICISRDVKFMEKESYNWNKYLENFNLNEPEWTNFSIDESPIVNSQSGDTTQTEHGEGVDTDISDQEGEVPLSPINTENAPESPFTPSPNTHVTNAGESPEYTSTSDSSSNKYDHTPPRGFRTIGSINEVAPVVEINELLLAEDEPRNYKEASEDEKWIEAMKAEIDSINKNHTWNLTTLPNGQKAIGLKWVFKTKRDANGNIIKHKARLVAKGYVQQHGIDFDEVFAPVARIETVRLILALAAYNSWEVHHLDVKSAFLHGELKEEVYVTQPEGFVKPETKERSETSILLVGVYVDDLIVTRTPKNEIDHFKSQMEKKFEMSDLGLLAYYLGIEVTQSGGEISIKQSAYINKILKDAKMFDCNDTKIPMDPGTKLTKTEGGISVNATEYRSIIGCLRYLLHTRPDLSYYVGLLSRFMQEPKEHHLKAIKQVLRYIKGTQYLVITYYRVGGCKITGYSDSSYGVNTEEGKGTTGIIFYFGNSPITWCTQKQQTVALSSCESEFMAATAASCQALWLKRLLAALTGMKEEKITLLVDNKSAIALMKNPVFHERSKHIDTRYHFIRECVENNHINVEHISGELQRADILTKALGRDKFITMRKLLGVQDLRQA
ncbi:hypothetical protein E3N88_04376 [Mikania micrantha]|uniref:Integrase catalytic domain-containing protein n=1 Tax=Mikania micrantha TaxID=192012 RepID=A0A5N6PWE5_9ASTR|nr:hypothetical protein E3N88_04376 [Mikania micrantha]